MYAILDIETTGGKYNEEGITEIAIYKFDGHEVVDQFASLINPERPIQPFVVKLTGINNDMLRQAPKFYEVAKRIIEITDGCVMVAHNALFDNRILSTEFDRLGYNFEKETLCTVELAQKLMPGMPSYSLGKLVRSLGIPLSDRHRAQGDAKATVSLFKMLLSKDASKEIIAETLRSEPKRKTDKKLLQIIERTPSETGIYYMHNESGKIIYIGKGKNIRKKLVQHFTNDNRKSQRLQLEVKSVSYEKTGNELISILKEFEEISRLKPKYNRSSQTIFHTHQLVSSIDNNGYINLKIEKMGRKKGLIPFSSYNQARAELVRLVEVNDLCPNFCDLSSFPEDDFNTILDNSNTTAIINESPENYNERVKEALLEDRMDNKSMLILDRGRTADERSVIWIDNGIYRGYAFYNLNHQINSPEILKSIVNKPEYPTESLHIIQSYLRWNKKLKTINLAQDSTN